MEDTDCTPTGQADASHRAISTCGLTTLVEPENPNVDIVFVHGFTGHPERTWTQKHANAPSHDDDPSKGSSRRLSKLRRLGSKSQDISSSRKSSVPRYT
ncbi:hypothetical protein F5Y15DRAFT_25795 [Xylariaceae sp. FL0016]|nr:hypothetical protein F5Y15DRAFT_25795 [Xylariaceae sp. FL0016]